MKKKRKLLFILLTITVVAIPSTVLAASYITADKYNENKAIAEQTYGTYTEPIDGEVSVVIDYDASVVSDPMAAFIANQEDNKRLYNKVNAPEYVEPNPTPSEPTQPSTPNTSTQPSEPSEPQTPSEPAANTQRQYIEAFVSRMYTVALNRNAEYTGLMFWSDGLERCEYDGASIARGFICSREFLNRNLSNEEFVNVLYRTFFDREADPSGWKSWNDALNQGKSRTYVLSGFVNSKEFADLCSSYNIARGTMEQDGSNIYNAGVRNFVLRNYTKALSRDGETEGVEFWCHQINTKKITALDCAESFFHSKEFLNKNLSNEQFIETCYQTFLDRSSDATGKAYWLQELSRGRSRDDILHGFAYSKEFSEIMRRYGVK